MSNDSSIIKCVDSDKMRIYEIGIFQQNVLNNMCVFVFVFCFWRQRYYSLKYNVGMIIFEWQNESRDQQIWSRMARKSDRFWPELRKNAIISCLDLVIFGGSHWNDTIYFHDIQAEFDVRPCVSCLMASIRIVVSRLVSEPNTKIHSSRKNELKKRPERAERERKIGYTNGFS